MQLAFLGTGLMGFPMAGRLLDAGRAVAVWNRTRAKAEPLARRGAAVADDPAEAVRGADVVFIILERGASVREVLFARGAAEAAGPGTLFVDMSSISPDEAKAHAARLSAMGLGHLDAPVSGGPDGAESGRLAIMVGGAEADFRRAEPFLKTMGRPTLVGEAGAGQLAKLANQMILSTTMSVVSEALLFARANGVEPDRIIEALSGGYADSRVLQNHGRRMIERDFRPGGHVHTFVKDLGAAFAVADERKLRLPQAGMAFERFRRLGEAGRAQCDISAIALLAEGENPGVRIGEGADRLPENDFSDKNTTSTS